MQQPWPAIAVMGAGAVGCYFGGLLARAGAPVTLIGRPQHVEAIQRQGLGLEIAGQRQFVPLAAATEPDAVRSARIILFCVKTLDTESAARAIQPHLASDALVVSLQNGVDNCDRIRTATGIDAIPAVVYVGAEMAAAGVVKHTARGELVIGRLPGRGPADAAGLRQIDENKSWHGLPARAETASMAKMAMPHVPNLHMLSALFARAGIPCRVSDTIEADLWKKLIINCAYNAISALGRARYGRIVANPFTRDLLRQVVAEAVAVGRAAGVPLPDMVEAGWQLGDSMPATMSSTAQDILRGKRTEIDALNGYVVRKGAELGLATPVNQTLHALVKLLEEAAGDSAG